VRGCYQVNEGMEYTYGSRRLLVSHVENATTFYAYEEKEATMMNDMKMLLSLQCETLNCLKRAPSVGDIVGVRVEDQLFRGRVEQLGQGESINVIKTKIIDFGWDISVDSQQLFMLDSTISNLKVRCLKYKLAGVRPKGISDGFSAHDRFRGRGWLRKLVNNAVVLATGVHCNKYLGTYEADCSVGNVNLNSLVLSKGFAVRKQNWC